MADDNQVPQRESLLRQLTLIEYHAKAARENLCNGVAVFEAAAGASPLVGNKQGPSHRDVLLHNAKQLQANVNGHLQELARIVERFLGVAPEPAEQDEHKQTMPTPKLALAD